MDVSMEDNIYLMFPLSLTTAKAQTDTERDREVDREGERGREREAALQLLWQCICPSVLGHAII